MIPERYRRPARDQILRYRLAGARRPGFQFPDMRAGLPLAFGTRHATIHQVGHLKIAPRREYSIGHSRDTYPSIEAVARRTADKRKRPSEFWILPWCIGQTGPIGLIGPIPLPIQRVPTGTQRKEQVQITIFRVYQRTDFKNRRRWSFARFETPNLVGTFARNPKHSFLSCSSTD